LWPGESWEECAAREVKEETGLSIHNIKFVFVTNTVMRNEIRPSHYVTIFMRGEQCNAADEPENLEPDKCDGWEWVEWPNVPEPIFRPLKSLIESNYELPQNTSSGNSSSQELQVEL
jgi:8-oxo-dGTP diphosphatase